MAALPPAFQVLLLSAIFMLALAGWLLWLDIGKTINRVFAAWLIVRATGFLIAIFRYVQIEDAAAVVLWTLLSPYTIIPLLPVSIYFICVYPKRRWLGNWRYGGVATVAFTLLSLLWVAVDSRAYGELVNGGARNSFNGAIGAYVFDPIGPLFTFNAARVLLFGFIGLILAWDYAKAKQGAGRNAVFLIMVGFVLNNLADGVRELYQRIDSWGEFATVDMWPWGWAPAYLPMAALVPTVASIAVIAWYAFRQPDRGPRRVATVFLVACAAPVLTAYIGEAKLGLGFLSSEDIRLYSLALWRLVIPILVTYGLLRYGIFDIDLKVKAGIRRAILLTIFGLTFFIVSETMEALIQQGGGTAFGLVAAGLLASASRPLERFAHGAADKLMPETKPLDALSLHEKHVMYREQLELVLQDEGVSPKERRMLNQLSLALGFSVEEQQALEMGSAIDVEEAPALQSKETTRSSIFVRAGIVAVLTALVFGVVSQIIELLIPVSTAQAGLATAAVIALLLGKIEGLASRLTGEKKELSPQQAKTLEDALREAWSDGILSARDRQYIGELETRLGILPVQRARIERRVRRGLGHRWYARA